MFERDHWQQFITVFFAADFDLRILFLIFWLIQSSWQKSALLIWPFEWEYSKFVIIYNEYRQKKIQKMCLAHDDCARRQFCAFRHNLCHSCLGKNERCNEDAECCGSDKKKRKNICYSARCMSESKVFFFWILKKSWSFKLG